MIPQDSSAAGTGSRSRRWCGRDVVVLGLLAALLLLGRLSEASHFRHAAIFWRKVDGYARRTQVTVSSVSAASDSRGAAGACATNRQRRTSARTGSLCLAKLRRRRQHCCQKTVAPTLAAVQHRLIVSYHCIRGATSAAACLLTSVLSRDTQMQTWRRSSVDAGGTKTVGDTIISDSIKFNSGTSTTSMSNAFIVQFIDAGQDLVSGIASLTYDWPGTSCGPFKVEIDSCCRISGLSNTGQTGYKVTSTVWLCTDEVGGPIRSVFASALRNNGQCTSLLHLSQLD